MASVRTRTRPRTSICVALVPLAIVAVRWLKKPRPLPFPPGPKPLPIIANALDFPRARPWETYTRWGQQYGDITHVKVLGMHIYILNSAEATGDLLDGRSNLYSSRPDMPIAELTGWHMTMATLPYGDTWRKHRVLYHNKFKQESIHQFIPLLTCKAHDLLRQLLATPDERVAHIRNYPAASLMYICYGHTIESHRDPLVEISETAAQEVAETILKGSLVNMLPMARHLPDWFGFQRSARECRRKVNLMLNVPYESVRRHMTSGNTVPSWMSEMLEVNDSNGGDKDKEEIIKSVTASSFAGKAASPLLLNPLYTDNHISSCERHRNAFAREIIWIAIATMLSVFQFDKAKTPEGEDIEVEGGFSDSLVIHPSEFKCSIKPRSQACEEAILKTPELKLDSLELRWFE
ncbi:hypothetical protein EYR36_003114 [Pleurotus pulmonarius]|nr:hypothetical protein EYR36_003114 [Pleurotus pulmonarius]